jgi:glycosyltransferase involved in cell wall biosynthesis
MPTISVLMPCYNATTTLAEALESLLAQSFADFEILAVDDGSMDESAAVLDTYAQKDSRVRVLRQVHGGIIPALNRAHAAAQGQFLARMDADDRCHPERFAKQIALFEAQPELALVSCQVKAFPSEDVREGFRIYLDWLNALCSDADIRREIFVESPLPHPSVMLRKQWLDQMGGYQDHGWPEDYDLWLRMHAAGARFGKVAEVLLGWRESPDRLTRSDSRYSLENFIRAKAHYLMAGPAADRSLIIWGAGMMGRRLAKQLEQRGAQIEAFIDIDPKKIGGTKRGRPVLAPDDLPDCWAGSTSPLILAAVGARGARALIRAQLQSMGFEEGRDWLGAA